ncbi:MAG: helix-turn-helix domain-containing protein [Oscillospiraceae bacterium]
MRAVEMARMDDNIKVVCSDGVCTVYSVVSPNGEGYMTSYEVFPGVLLQYNDFHMENIYSGFVPGSDIFCIDHCREGRIEWERPDGRYIYIEAGDMHLCTRRCHDANFTFPLRHYHGITAAISLEEANLPLQHLFDGVDIDIHALANKFTGEEDPFILRAGDSIQHVFSELYRVPESLRLPYCKVKILELLVFLTGIDPSGCSVQKPYYHRLQVEKVKRIERMMTAAPDQHFTLEELSQKYNIPLTSLKICFKGVFGDSVYNYMRIWRMNAAAVQLRQTNSPVISIANGLGYENASKFASAFKAVIGKTPTAYRKSLV